VHVYNSATATDLPGWPRQLTIKANPISPSPALADFNGDGKLEIVVANNGGPSPSLSRMQIYDWQGNVLPGWPQSVGGENSESSPVVADLSGDGVADVLFANETGFLYGWDWHGTELSGFPITVGDFVRSTPYVDDVDGDGNVNVVLAGWDKNVYVWNFSFPWNPQAAFWPTLKHDVHRSGTYGFVYDTVPPQLPASIGSASHTRSTWSNDNTVEVQWSAARDQSGIAGYSIVWDTDSTTVPDESIDVAGTSTTSPPLAEGQSHWFHVRPVDTLGYWTAGALHFGPFWIDTTPPANSPNLQADRATSAWSTDNTIGMTWDAVVERPAFREARRAREVVGPREGGGQGRPRGSGLAAVAPRGALLSGSGIAGYSYVWDTNPATVPDALIETSQRVITSPPLADGPQHWFHLRTVDGAGNPSLPQATLHLGPFWIDATPPQNPSQVSVSPPTGTWSTADTILVAWSNAFDGASGVAGFSWLFDAAPSTIPDDQFEPGTSALLTPPPEGFTFFHLRTRDVAGNWSTVLVRGPFGIDRLPPVVTVLAPNGGEHWAHGSLEHIRWHATDAASGVISVRLHYSTDGGATFPNLIANVAATDSQYAWTVPLDVSSTARVRVSATDFVHHEGTDASDADFALTPATDVVSAPPVTRTWLEGAAPNPFNPSTTLRYSLLETGHVQLAVFDARGRHLRTLVDAVQEGGHWYSPLWDGRDGTGRVLASGVYLVRFRAPGSDQVRRVVMLR
jgi:hypothetical protein